ncbi:hypothetical protein QOT17_016119 [Balamuthia mandrillaris]
MVATDGVDPSPAHFQRALQRFVLRPNEEKDEAGAGKTKPTKVYLLHVGDICKFLKEVEAEESHRKKKEEGEGYGVFVEANRRMMLFAEESVKPLEKLCHEAAVPCKTCIITEGEAGEVICEAAEKHKVDFLILGHKAWPHSQHNKAMRSESVTTTTSVAATATATTLTNMLHEVVWNKASSLLASSSSSSSSSSSVSLYCCEHAPCALILLGNGKL